MNAIRQICILSKDGVCLLDMNRVLEAAKQKNLSDLVEIITRDLPKNDSTNGEYYKLLQQIGVAS
jgi:hypothetical protein